MIPGIYQFLIEYVISGLFSPLISVRERPFDLYGTAEIFGEKNRNRFCPKQIARTRVNAIIAFVKT